MKKCISLRTFSIGIILCAFIAITANVNLYSQYKRNIVFEEFSEVWCGPCASLAPMLAVWLENHPDYIPIYYYSYFSVNGDAKYYAKDEYDARYSFYKVPFYPYARINSELAPNVDYPGFPTDTSKINTIIDNMAKTTPVKVVIDFTNNGATGTVKVDLTSDEAMTNKNMYIMIVEKHHQYANQPNNQSEFHHIMRQVLPLKNGLKFSINAGQTLHYEYNYSIPTELNYDLFATVIVQDSVTKYVYQAESVFKPFIVSVNEDINEATNLVISPNPISDKINIQLNSKDENVSSLAIYDLIGNIVYLKNNISMNNLFALDISDFKANELQNGVYYLKVQTEKSVYMKKFIVAK